jgi:PPOX class probable FMN-dependent enzyme
MHEAPDDAVSLRAYVGTPSELATAKELATIDRHARAFIALSPFLVIASSGSEGADASPRGDAPGFVAVLDERTLLIPDRPGNKRVDTWSNLVEHPAVGLLFMVPGMNETLRINGQGRLTTELDLLEPLAVNGKIPRLGLIVAVDAVYLHCAKALVRSDLWNPAKHIERSSFPSLGQILADQIGEPDPAALDRSLAEGVKTRLY